MIDQASGHILHVAQAVSNEHDVTLARQHTEAFPPGCLCLGDLGYQGLEIEGCRILIPFKKPRLRELEPEQVAFNQVFARFRVKVEHSIRLLKVFRS
ncbi:MAG: transposase [Candidatus Thiothrix singaporensis]|uniref:Transposase n=1 Tax=Candidatus Thiothrix singaporensis TaxID=2799669 RepID=A0A7L6AYD7_9GAMM|nr:MAG: transposase [Candidatus Thiothrix singaporensis]